VEIIIPPISIEGSFRALRMKHGKLEIVDAYAASFAVCHKELIVPEFLWPDLLVPREKIKQVAKLYLCDPGDQRIVLGFIFAMSTTWDEIRNLPSCERIELVNTSLPVITRDEFVSHELFCHRNSQRTIIFYHCSRCGGPYKGLGSCNCVKPKFPPEDFQSSNSYLAIGRSLPDKIRKFIVGECGHEFAVNIRQVFPSI
jgi:uncharacterized membrane protein